MLCGVLNINKSPNMTSFDVVAIIRRKLHGEKTGHLGTLDPMASGVLPIAIGRATRIMDYLDWQKKEYIADMRFGITTDTDDIWGNILSETLDISLDENDIADAIEKFIGITDQVPPIYSALKLNGKKLYQYAREGEKVKAKSRKILIESIDMMDFFKEEDFYNGRFKIVCSKGTYIRSIARDLGDMFGTGCVMSGLIRTMSNGLRIEDSLDMGEIEEMNEKDLRECVIPVDKFLDEFPKVILREDRVRLFRNGVKLDETEWKNTGETSDIIKNFPLPLPEKYFRLYRVYDEEGYFIGVGEEIGEGKLKADKVFA